MRGAPNSNHGQIIFTAALLPHKVNVRSVTKILRTKPMQTCVNTRHSTFTRNEHKHARAAEESCPCQLRVGPPSGRS